MDRVPLSAGAVTDIAARQLSFSSVGVFMPLKQNLAYAAEDAPLPITGGLAGAGFFSTLGVRPRLGRLSTDDDVSPGAPRVATVSYGAWQRLFGGDPDV